jgi:hypothetical protein
MMHSKSTEALLKKMIPGKAHRRVFDLMLTTVGMHRGLSTIEIQTRTGHNSDEQRLRDIRSWYKYLFIVHHCTYRDRGGSHNEYQLRQGWAEILREHERGSL